MDWGFASESTGTSALYLYFTRSSSSSVMQALGR